MLKLQKIIKSKYFIPGLLFILIIPAFIFLLRPGIYWNMHDDMQLIRQLEFEKCLFDGQIPCRWTPDLGYGYGYPLFNYYPPFPYIVGQLFRFVGLSLVNTIKYTAVLQIVLAALFMYILASSLFGQIGGLISGLFYTYAPYHAVDIYVRGAMNEAWAAVFFPLILYFSKKLIETPKTRHFIGLAVAFACLLLSHDLMALIFTPVVVVWSLYWIYALKLKRISASFRIVLRLFLSALLSFGLAAYFTLPVLFESKLVQIDSMFTNYYTYSFHYATVFQLFIRNFWGDGTSVPGPNDGMSFSIGYLQWIIPSIILIIFATKYLKTRQLTTIEISVIGLILTAFFSAFMSHDRSTFIWKLVPVLQKLQFPWRFLNLTVFLFSLVTGFLPLIIFSKKINNHLSYAILAVLIILLSAFMSHDRSTFIWKLVPVLQKPQFPWRFLNLPVFLFFLVAGSLPLIIFSKIINNHPSYAILAVLMILLIAINIQHYTPITYGPLTDQQNIEGDAWINQDTRGIYDYLPKTASKAPERPANQYIDEIIPANTSYNLTGQKKGSDWQFFNLDLTKPATIYLSEFAFPKFVVYDNQHQLNYQIEPVNGRISLNLDAGQHQIYLKLKNTPIRTVANYISLFSFVVVIYLSLPKKWRKLT